MERLRLLRQFPHRSRRQRSDDDLVNSRLIVLNFNRGLVFIALYPRPVSTPRIIGKAGNDLGHRVFGQDFVLKVDEAFGVNCDEGSKTLRTGMMPSPAATWLSLLSKLERSFMWTSKRRGPAWRMALMTSVPARSP
jgi:hypothetical protein